MEFTPLARQIRSTIDAYGANERGCAELAEHIDEVIRALPYIQFDAPFATQLEQPLFNLQACLEECFILVQDFSSASDLGQFFLSRRYKRKFDKLNNQLNNCKSRLVFIMQIHDISSKTGRPQLTTTTPFNFDGRHRQKPVDRLGHRPLTPQVTLTFACCVLFNEFFNIETDSACYETIAINRSPTSST